MVFPFAHHRSKPFMVLQPSMVTRRSFGKKVGRENHEGSGRKKRQRNADDPESQGEETEANPQEPIVTRRSGQGVLDFSQPRSSSSFGGCPVRNTPILNILADTRKTRPTETSRTRAVP